MIDIPRYLDLASYLNSDWSLADEICEDMDVTRSYLRELIRKSRVAGLGIEFEDGKLRLNATTSPSQVLLMINSLPE